MAGREFYAEGVQGIEGIGREFFAEGRGFAGIPADAAPVASIDDRPTRSIFVRGVQVKESASGEFFTRGIQVAENTLDDVIVVVPTVPTPFVDTATRTFFAEGVQVREGGSGTFFAEGVQVNENTLTAAIVEVVTRSIFVRGIQVREGPGGTFFSRGLQISENTLDDALIPLPQFLAPLAIPFPSPYDVHPFVADLKEIVYARIEEEIRLKPSLFPVTYYVVKAYDEDGKWVESLDEEFDKETPAKIAAASRTAAYDSRQDPMPDGLEDTRFALTLREAALAAIFRS